jgi:hypothetical protein
VTEKNWQAGIEYEPNLKPLTAEAKRGVPCGHYIDSTAYLDAQLVEWSIALTFKIM